MAAHLVDKELSGGEGSSWNDEAASCGLVASSSSRPGGRGGGGGAGGGGEPGGQTCAGIAGILGKIAPTVLLSAMMHTFLALEGHIYVPYLYTRVRCCTGPGDMLPATWDMTDPVAVQKLLAKANGTGIGVSVRNGTIAACDMPVFPPASDAWSFSTTCPNKAYNQRTAQELIGTMKPLQKTFAFIVLPLGGALSDGVGRVPVLALYSCGLLLACLLYLLDSSVYAGRGDTLVYIACCLFGLIFQPTEAVISGAIADVLGSDEGSKGQAFLAMHTVNGVFSFFSDIAVYFYLRTHQGSYSWLWAGFVGGAVFITVLVALTPETLPGEMRSKLQLGILNPCAASAQALSVIAQDWVLVVQACMMFLFYISFLGFMTLRSSYLTSLGFALEDTILPGMLATLSSFILSAVLLPFVPRLGMWTMLMLGLLLYALGYVAVGPFTLLVSMTGPYISSLLGVWAGVLTFTAFRTIISQRVGKEHQGKGQAAVSAVGTLGGVVGIPLYNKVLFNPQGTPFQKMLPALVSTCIALACLVASVLMASMAHRLPGADNAEEEDESLEDSPVTGG